ncbi:Fibronectin type III domain-containing protein [Herbiconiux ginsengi]|uniref:Fibronectin type III domain-containing protein n=1 Tax=Herbiconiux ginsengi TaxID=381665 RepID=A0A1H3S191_9MICO|nr:Fibronectin type III domain-containing protein [Herbiconiux ginsengi]
MTLLTSETGSYLPRVEVSINGSDPIPMMIDTGTNFMVVFPGAIVNPAEPVFDTGIAQGIDYDGTSASGTIARARVEVGGVVSTPGDVAFLDATSCTPHCLGYQDDIGGVIGIGQRLADAHNQGDPKNDLFSPLAQLDEQQSVGFTVDFTAENPVIRVGKPTDAGETDTVLQRTQDDDLFYPTGQPVFDEPEVCWTIDYQGDHAKACNDTVFDTGQSTGMIRGDQFTPIVDPVHSTPEPGSGAVLLGWVKTGASVSWASSSTAEPYAEIEEPGVNPYRYGLFSGDKNETFNAGNGFYLKHTIGFDNTTGEVIISATAGTPTGPAEVHADAGTESITAHWQAPQDAGGSAITHYLIRVAPVDGGAPVVMKADADATHKKVDGLVAGQAYWVSVAAANDYGVGQRVRAAGQIVPTAAESPSTPTPTAGPALANTGDGGVSGALWGVLLLAGAGAALLLVRRGIRRSS